MCGYTDTVEILGEHYTIEVEHMESIKAMQPDVAVNVYSLRATQLETGPPESPPLQTPEHRIRRALFPSATPTTGGSAGRQDQVSE